MVNLLRCLLIWLWACSAIANAAEFRAEVDRLELTTDEHVLLTLTLTNSDTRLRAVGVDPNVDLSVLTKHFDLGTPRDSHRFNMYRDGGRSTSEIRVELFPKRPGELVIPTFVVDGLKSQKITLHVASAKDADAPLLFTRHGTTSGAPLQNAPLLLWLDVYSRVALAEAKLGGEIELEPLPLDALEHQRLAVSKREETIGGMRYEIMRMSWVLYPSQSGAMKCHFPDVWITTTSGDQRRLPRTQLDLTIQALPATATADALLGKPQLNVDIADENIHAGDAFTLRVTLKTNSRRLTIPAELMLRAPPNLQLYTGAPRIETSTSPDGLVNIATYSYSVTAPNAGVWTGLEFGARYFDIDRSAMDVVSVSSAPIDVAPARAQTTVANSAAQSVAMIDTAPASTSDYWRRSAWAFGMLWMATLAAWWLQQRRARVSAGNTVSSNGEKHRGDTRPLEAMLLRAFDAASLDEGLAHYELHHGVDETIRAAVRAVQTHYYDRRHGAGVAKNDMPDIAAVAGAIRGKMSATKVADCSSPEQWLAPQRQK